MVDKVGFRCSDGLRLISLGPFTRRSFRNLLLRPMMVTGWDFKNVYIIWIFFFDAEEDYMNFKSVI